MESFEYFEEQNHQFFDDLIPYYQFVCEDVNVDEILISNNLLPDNYIFDNYDVFDVIKIKLNLINNFIGYYDYDNNHNHIGIKRINIYSNYLYIYINDNVIDRLTFYIKCDELLLHSLFYKKINIIDLLKWNKLKYDIYIEHNYDSYCSTLYKMNYCDFLKVILKWNFEWNFENLI